MKFSLQRRLIYAVIVSQLLLAAGLVIVGAVFLGHYALRAFHVYLEGRAQSVAAAVYYPDDGGPGLLFNGTKLPLQPRHGPRELFWLKSDQRGLEKYSEGIDATIFEQIPPDAPFWTFDFRGNRYQAIILHNVAIQDTEAGIPQPFPTLTVAYAAPMSQVEHEMIEAGTAFGVVILVILAPTLWLAIWSIRKALGPLHSLAAAAGKISVEAWNFEPSSEALATQELQPLIAAIRTVLAGLEAAFSRQREFMGDAAHELKTSLAILKSTLQMLLARPRERNEYEGGLMVMSRDCERLERLLNRMLETARAEQRIAGDRATEIDPVDLSASCEMAVAHLAQFAAAREIRIDLSVSGECLLRAELADLELIWINLLENAIQYSPYGSAVSMAVAVNDSTATVTVADRGCGIDPAHLPYIFERFYRADSSRARTTGGFGLGLAIAKSLVEFYGGSIGVESQSGRGSRFIVDFPLEAALAIRP